MSLLNILPYDTTKLVLNSNLNSSYVSLSPQLSPQITSQPISTSGASGSGYSFTVSGSNVPISYIWRLNGVTISGATGNVLTINNATTLNTGYYYSVLYNQYGYAGTNQVVLYFISGSGSGGSGSSGSGWTGTLVGSSGIYLFGISGVPNNFAEGTGVSLYLTGSGFDPTTATFFWEGSNIQNSSLVGNSGFTFVNNTVGPQWIESEVTLIDGTRLISSGVYNSQLLVTNYIELYGVSGNPLVKNWWKFDGTSGDSVGSAGNITFNGNAAFDNSTFFWANRPSGQAVAVNGQTDWVEYPSLLISGTGLFSAEAMFYVSSFVPEFNGNCNVFSLFGNYNRYFRVFLDQFNGLFLQTYESGNLMTQAQLLAAIPTNTWCQMKLQIDGHTGYSYFVNGNYVTGISSGNLLVSDFWYNNNVDISVGQFNGWLDELVIKQSN